MTEVGLDAIRDSLKSRVAHGDFAYSYAQFRRENGLATPDMVGPNWAETAPVSRDEVSRFHRELTTKLSLQRSRRYRLLYWRKLTRELKPFVGRYVTWFRHRVLGSSRRVAQESPRSTSSFR